LLSIFLKNDYIEINKTILHNNRRIKIYIRYPQETFSAIIIIIIVDE